MKLFNFLVIFPMIFGACFSIRSNEVNNSRTICFTDRDCPDSDFCSIGNLCYPCFSCKNINQENSLKRCAKSVKDCGQCLPGYAQTNFISANKRTVCTSVVTLAAPMTAEDRDQFAVNPAMVIGLLVIGTLAATAFVSWKCYGKRSTAVIQDSWNEMGLSPRARCGDGASLPPPSYEDCQNSENGSIAYSFQFRVRPEKQTTAIPFQMPVGEHIVSLAQTSQENSNAANTENVSNVPVNDPGTSYQPPVAIDIHDESTQPSLWTPGTAYLMNQNIDETDGSAKDDKASPPNKRRKTEEEEEEKKVNDS